MNRLTKLLFLFILPLLFACTQKEPEVQEVRVESVAISQSSAELEIGKTLQLNATVSPSTATRKDITWSSSKSSVASVSASGLVTAVSEGTTTITATADGKKGECTVSVVKKAIAVSEIRLDKTELTLYEGDEGTLTATIVPADATPKEDITWSSSNPDVATVDGGKVRAVSMGNATITASLEGFKAECSVVVKGMKYGKIPITSIRPIDILPVIGQVTNGDPKVYDHIEHLRLAEATRIRDMMWEYGAGDHSKEEYRQLMGRLITGMTNEIPLGYDNYTFIGNWFDFREPSNHAHVEWFILNTLVKYANFIVVGIDKDPIRYHESLLLEFVKTRPNAIIITGNSSAEEATTKEQFDLVYTQVNGNHTAAIELNDCKNSIHFAAGTNITEDSGSLRYKIYNGDYVADEHGRYSACSLANSDKNTRPESHLLVTIATNKTGDISVDEDLQTGSTTFPIGFADNVLFAGRIFPYHSMNTGEITATDSKYATSEPNYVNVALMDVCFQLYAEVKDVDVLLEMVRSTAHTDHVRLEGKDQPLILINPAGLYKKYLTPQNLPTSISSGETLNLDKGYYKGVLFSIPGAEVKVNGEWIAYDNKNKDVILSQNPMSLEWRLNGDLLKKYGYSSGQTVEGQIITVDDKWGGLRLEVPMTIQVR